MQIYYTVHTKDILTKLFFIIIFFILFFFFASQAQLLAIQQKA